MGSNARSIANISSSHDWDAALPSPRMKSRSTTLRSCRMLPGHAWPTSDSMTPFEIDGAGLSYWGRILAKLADQRRNVLPSLAGEMRMITVTQAGSRRSSGSVRR